MTDLSTIVPKPNQRMLIVGTTGSGKSTLGLALLPFYRHVLIIDPIWVVGGKEGLTGYRLAATPEELARLGKSGHPRLQYRPHPEHQEWESYDLVYHWAFERGETMVYTDEGLRVMKGSKASPWMNACLTAGRQRGVGMITCTQRPTGIDLRLVSESESYACFKLRKVADRERMGEVMGDIVSMMPATGHNFWYSNDKLDKPLYYCYHKDRRLPSGGLTVLGERST